MGAPEESGGMNLYARELIHAWSENEDNDEIIVVGGGWAQRAFARLTNVRVVPVPDGGVLRIVSQWLFVAACARRWRADAIVSVSLIVTPFAGRRPRVCIVHDWRHVAHPDEFGWLRRLYRRLWVWSVNNATVAIQISAKTDAETSQLARKASRRVVPSGRDHPARWEVVDQLEDDGSVRILTFGHHANKRPELLIRAVAHLPAAGAGYVVTILGARGPYAQSLHRLADQLALRAEVVTPGYVDDPEYQKLVQRADIVALVSSDEGFGLPVVEAGYFGIPVVVTADSGLGEIHGDRVLVAAPDPREVADTLEEAARVVDLAVENETDTWSFCAQTIRACAGEVK